MGGYNNIKIKGTLAQWLEHHIIILKVVIVKVTGSNPVCASIINKLTYKHMKKILIVILCTLITVCIISCDKEYPLGQEKDLIIVIDKDTVNTHG